MKRFQTNYQGEALLRQYVTRKEVVFLATSVLVLVIGVIGAVNANPENYLINRIYGGGWMITLGAIMFHGAPEIKKIKDLGPVLNALLLVVSGCYLMMIGIRG
jgi:hypothetical protein